MARQPRANSPAPEPRTAQEREIYEFIHSKKHQHWERALEEVVEAAVKYRKEQGRQDALQQARLSKAFSALMQRMEDACEARRRLKAPITNADLDRHSRMEDWKSRRT